MKKIRFCRAALPLLLALGACQPGVATYTTSEAPHNLELSSAPHRIAVRFLPGSTRLARGEAQRLKRLVLLGAILPQDRVAVAAAGGWRLASAREAVLSRMLLPYRIVVEPAAFPWAARDRALITIDRTLVTLPACPNWSGPTPERFNNQPASNFGCATATDRGLMVANPTDLVRGEPLGPADAGPAVIATNLYLTNKVPPPGGATASAPPASAPSVGAGAATAGP